MGTERRGPATEWIVGWAAATLLAVAFVAGVVIVSGGDSTENAPRKAYARTATVPVGDRPVTVHLPASYVDGTPMPLVVLLHGYTASGSLQEQYFRITPEADRRGFVYAYPDGTVDRTNKRFWNATDTCCDLYQTGVDDSRYLRDVIDTVKRTYSIDPRRVYLIGHSNGAFMSFRMACDHADTVTAIATLAGSTWNDISRCRPSSPVSVLAIHGTADRTILYGGGTLSQHTYPAATRTATDWASLDGCGGPGADRAPLDVVADLPGAETTVHEVASGCRGGSSVVTWTIDKGVHIPNLGAAFTPSVLDFLLARTKGEP
jgi:polyhydroxybutyrate depolymerase